MPALMHLLAGPNGSGKTTFQERVLDPVLHLPFINADRIARERWPRDAEARAYEAAQLAEEYRRQAIAAGQSFITETVFSHDSKLGLIRDAKAAGYLVALHVVMVPLDLAMERVRLRVLQGGHSVPEDKQRERYARLWRLIAAALPMADECFVYDNSKAARPYRLVAHFERGRLLGAADWPAWAEFRKMSVFSVTSASGSAT